MGLLSYLQGLLVQHFPPPLLVFVHHFVSLLGCPRGSEPPKNKGVTVSKVA